jgi:hypothetical protein
MTIEHRYFDTREDNHAEGTWSIKVKHTFTNYPDERSSPEDDNEAFGQIVSTINNTNIEPNRDAVDMPDHNFIAGIRVEAEPTLPSNDFSEEREPSYGYPLYEGTLTPDNRTTRDEQETLMAAEERRDTRRYPRSGIIAHYTTEHENYHRGYRFYSGVSSLLW